MAAGVISLTAEQRAAVAIDGHAYLSACPGSGKTRVIASKLLIQAEKCLATPRRIGCLTYTNAAVEEIEARVRKTGTDHHSEYCWIGTIHSFCLQHVLRPYRWLTEEVSKSFKVLTPESREFRNIVETVEEEHGRQVNLRTFEEYASIRRGLDGKPVGPGITKGIVTTVSAQRYWELSLGRGYVDFSQILYFSWKILHENHFVGVGIASKFDWLLVDEFQDTTDIQIEIFKELHRFNRVKFFLVGDTNQSINGFAGARPDLAQIFSTNIGAKLDLTLSGNFRSGKHIIVPCERLIARKPSMYSTGKAEAYVGSATHTVVANYEKHIISHTLPEVIGAGIAHGGIAILAPWWADLIPIARALRIAGIPAVGPGARPYKRSRLFAVLAEQLGASIESVGYMPLQRIESAIFRLANEADGVARFDIFSYAGRVTALALVYAAQEAANHSRAGKDWLITCAKSSGEILFRDGWISGDTVSKLEKSVEEMFVDMAREKIEVSTLQIADLGMFADPRKAVHLMTLHNSKGREFDAVTIIRANKGRIPHFSARSKEEFDEARRLFYVGISRPKRFLSVLSDNQDLRNPTTPFVSDAGL